MARRAFPFQPTMNSGFPHHRDSWISAAATSWAVLALTQVLAGRVRTGQARNSHNRRSRLERRTMSGKSISRNRSSRSWNVHVPAVTAVKSRVAFSALTARDAILKGGASGEAAIVPGHSEKSPLIDYVSGNVPDSEMPPKAQRKRFPALSTNDVALLRAWIDQGAEWPKDMVLTSPKTEGGSYANE